MDFVRAQMYQDELKAAEAARQQQIDNAAEGARRAIEAREHDLREDARVAAHRNRWTPQKQAQIDLDRRVEEQNTARRMKARKDRLERERLANLTQPQTHSKKKAVHPWRR